MTRPPKFTQTGQIAYQDVLDAIARAGDEGTITLDEESSTMVFDCGGLCSRWTDLIDDRTNQIWYDSPESLAPKYALASEYGLKGVGMWESTKVDYEKGDAGEMWASLCQRT